MYLYREQDHKREKKIRAKFLKHQIFFFSSCVSMALCNIEIPV